MSGVAVGGRDVKADGAGAADFGVVADEADVGAGVGIGEELGHDVDRGGVGCDPKIALHAADPLAMAVFIDRHADRRFDKCARHGGEVGLPAGGVEADAPSAAERAAGTVADSIAHRDGVGVEASAQRIGEGVAVGVGRPKIKAVILPRANVQLGIVPEDRAGIALAEPGLDPGVRNRQGIGARNIDRGDARIAAATVVHQPEAAGWHGTDIVIAVPGVFLIPKDSGTRCRALCGGTGAQGGDLYHSRCRPTTEGGRGHTASLPRDPRQRRVDQRDPATIAVGPQQDACRARIQALVRDLRATHMRGADLPKSHHKEKTQTKANEGKPESLHAARIG